MKKLAVLFAMVLSLFVATACGSDSDPQITPDTLAAAMDEVCDAYTPTFEDLGTRGLTNGGLALEFEGSSQVRQMVVDELSGLDADDAAQKELDKYIAVSEKVISADKKIVEAAKDDDDAAVNEAFAEQSAAFSERDRVATEIGTEVCGKSTEVRVEETGTTPPEDLNYAEPKNTIEEASKGYVAAIKAGNCAQINKNRHTDAGDLAPEECMAAQASLKGAFIEGSESYGPVGMAEVVSGDGTHFPTVFIEDLDRNLRYAADTIHDGGGLRPAPEDNDADETVDTLFTAIQDGDVESFNSVLPDADSGFHLEADGSIKDFSDGQYSEAFLEDVKSGAEPVQLGINAAFAFYFLEGTKNDWVINLLHRPGTGGHYAFSGYYPIPKAE